MNNFVRNQSIKCKYCQSTAIVKYGTFEGMQRYFCKICRRKFADNDALPKMKTPIWIISLVLDSYYKGMSLGSIQKEIDQRHGAYYAESSIYNWIIRFSKEAIEQAKSFHPKTGDTLCLCATPIKSEKRQLRFMDIFDINSKFLLASRIFETETRQSLMNFIKSASLTTKNSAQTLIILLPDDAFDFDSLDEASQKRLTNKIIFKMTDKEITGQFNELLKKRRHIIHGFKNMENAQILAGAWQVHYNFIAGNEKAARIPPAQKMRATPFRTWADIVTQSIKD